jgi:hypothetical protein
MGWVIAVATAPANSERPIACKYDGYQNLLNWAVVGSIIYLYQEIIIHLLQFLFYHLIFCQSFSNLKGLVLNSKLRKIIRFSLIAFDHLAPVVLNFLISSSRAPTSPFSTVMSLLIFMISSSV